jgi:hypothetical protein
MLLRIAMPANCPPMRYWTTKYSREPHCDLMHELGGWNLQDRINLDFAGRRILGRGKTERDYLTYVDLIEKGEGEKIGLDNLCDTQLTYDIYRAVEPYLF